MREGGKATEGGRKEDIENRGAGGGREGGVRGAERCMGALGGRGQEGGDLAVEGLAQGVATTRKRRSERDREEGRVRVGNWMAFG